MALPTDCPPSFGRQGRPATPRPSTSPTTPYPWSAGKGVGGDTLLSLISNVRPSLVVAGTRLETSLATRRCHFTMPEHNRTSSRQRRYLLSVVMRRPPPSTTGI